MQPLAVSIAFSLRPYFCPPFLFIPSSLRPPFFLLDPQKQIYKIRALPLRDHPTYQTNNLILGREIETLANSFQISFMCMKAKIAKHLGSGPSAQDPPDP